MRNIISLSQWEPMYVDAMDIGHDTMDMLFSFWFCYKQALIDNENKWMQIIKEHKSPNVEFYLDSGVFSARKLNISIPTELLINFYHKHPYIDYVFGMDDGDEKEQFEKTSSMIKEGVPTIPIIHMGLIDYSYIEKYMELGINFFAVGTHHIGGILNNNKIGYTKAFDDFFNYIIKNNLWPLKIHALGTENFYIANRWPFYSFDSSNVINTAIYGNITYMNNKKLYLDRVNPRMTPLKATRVDPFLDQYLEKSYQKKGEPGAKARHARFLQAIEKRFKYQKLITDLWTERGVVWE
jgi:hypothetical protein